jgi:hypothetical protein
VTVNTGSNDNSGIKQTEMQKTGTLPQKRRMTPKTAVKNSAQESRMKIAISHSTIDTLFTGDTS